MGGVDVDLIDIKNFSDENMENFLKENAISLSVFEARKVVELIGRNPTIT